MCCLVYVPIILLEASNVFVPHRTRAYDNKLDLT